MDRCTFYTTKRTGMKETSENQLEIIREGYCNKAEAKCDCKGAKSSCDKFDSIRAEYKIKEDAKPIMQDVDIIIKYREDGSYSIGWKKLFGGELYGGYKMFKKDEDIVQAMTEYFPVMYQEIVEAKNTYLNKGE